MKKVQIEGRIIGDLALNHIIPAAIKYQNELLKNVNGLKEAGFWEAMTRISTYYLLFVNTLLTVYYYPKLVQAKTNEETKSVFWSFYKNVLPLFAVGLFVIYLFRTIMIKILFTQDFEPVSNLFLPLICLNVCTSILNLL